MKPYQQAFVGLAAAASLVGANAFVTPTFSTSSRRPRTAKAALKMSADLSDVRVMVNGMPGPMAAAAAEACLRKGLDLAPVALTGPDVTPCTITVSDSVTGKTADVRLIPADQGEEIDAAVEGMQVACGPDNLLAIDFTHPSAVNGNAKFYAEKNIPFVMGTTGGDRDQLMKDMEEAKHSAVIAPNMAKQIVALQAGLEDLAKKFPGAFAGYKINVRESHQKTKADTSGTAKAVVASLNELGDDDFELKDIEKIRDDDESMKFGVPEEGLNGHAFHTYTFTSPDGSVEFQLQHNVVGRTVYAEGTADGIKFLAGKIREGGEGKIYNMIDVLQAGVME
mmetsp:Transcript_10138/g.29987  ORF Transcript_10138/g.29987 Transcript_10138/m.29987 type:complete len:337 (-) Transcript_10138:108-1118(-)